MDDDHMYTYITRTISRESMDKHNLSKLDSDFYQRVKVFTKKLCEQHEKPKAENIIRNMEIFMYNRARKIMNFSVNSSVSEPIMQALAEEEKNLYTKSNRAFAEFVQTAKPSM